ncbi:LysR family transcriptional regulator [Acutalibacter caecimuris]|uniref:LysR family transcriptional regulator n=1 Tax=Acutalibacter caecimuris TaxID=3093657 RepID=UPI002AC920A3|nr:LysR family transcriptional regulator [Acutalibacter sp. M00118]
MELRVLRYFLMVAREENITRAAEKLHITQPTLSRQLMQLEEGLGATLFRRNNHRITLTEDGMLLKRRAQELLELAEKTRREFQSREELTGEIAIGCGETRNMAYLSDLMVSFRERHPLIQFRIYSATADEVKDRMENGLLDMGLLLMPADISRYHTVPIPYQERWCALVREDSLLAQLTSVAPADLLPYPLLLGWREQVLDLLNQWFGEELSPRVSIAARYNLINNAAVMVHSGMGVALTLDKGFLPHPYLTQVPLSPPMESGAVLAWKREQARSRTMEQFITHIKESSRA